MKGGGGDSVFELVGRNSFLWKTRCCMFSIVFGITFTPKGMRKILHNYSFSLFGWTIRLLLAGPEFVGPQRVKKLWFRRREVLNSVTIAFVTPTLRTVLTDNLLLLS